MSNPTNWFLQLWYYQFVLIALNGTLYQTALNLFSFCFKGFLLHSQAIGSIQREKYIALDQIHLYKRSS